MKEPTLQEIIDQQSRTITQLCEAIDPACSHGPETEKLVAYEKEIREKVLLLLTNLYDDAISSDDKNTSGMVLPLVKLLGWREQIRLSLWPPKKVYP